MGNLVFFDLETGGLNPQKHAIIQIAAVAVDGDFKTVESFEQKVLFQLEKAEPEALEVNSFDAEVWEREAISPWRAARSFADFLGRHAAIELTSRKGNPYRVARLAGHNAAVFDGPFLQSWFKRLDRFLPASFQVLDTLQLALWYFDHLAPRRPENLKLATLCAFFGVKHEEAHDALADVRATAELAERLLFLLRSDDGTLPTAEDAVADAAAGSAA